MTADIAKKIISQGLHEPDARGVCSQCGKGLYHGRTYKTCDNVFCELYDSYAFEKCPHCGEERRACLCL